MNITQIETTVTNLLKKVNRNTFIYDLLLAYGKPKSSIKRLSQGNLNMSKNEGEVSWKKEVFFKTFEGQLLGADDLDEVLADAIKTIKHKQRFVVVTDFKRFLAMDTKTIDRLDIHFKDLGKNYAFFLPWAGMEKAQHLDENPADVKAAERMAKLFDELKKDNPADTPEGVSNLNVFLSRLLFCFFAEDTNIFEDHLFTYSIESHTQKDGSDVHTYLNKLFAILNLPEGAERKALPEHLAKYPYVNGGLFANKIESPAFSKKSRQILIDSGELDWQDINPDIFGSMFQAVIAVDQRGTLGQHYTSVPNIMKVIQPLFLDELYEAYEEAKGNEKKINELLLRLGKIKIFDPACGSGNFLIIAYKELRILEMKIFKETGQMAFSAISLSQFYGIEIDDFAHEIAILALWLAEHQMNVAFFNEFGRTNPTLPLKAAGNITQGNACRLDWEMVCPKNENDEIYILGNPPYLGGRMQSPEQKKDLDLVYHFLKKAPKVDYISAWFIKASCFISNTNAKAAFVSTNSICQGEQINMIWPHVFQNNQEIDFANKDFKWTNNAKKKAAVIVSIIGIRNNSKSPKYLFHKNTRYQCKNINAYLVDSSDVFVKKRSSSISKMNKMEYGNMAIDGGHLILSLQEKKEITFKYPGAEKLIKQIFGAQEYLNSKERYCLWLNDDELDFANTIPEVKLRIQNVKEKRESGNDKGVRELSKKPHQFREMKMADEFALIFPTVSSERRNYIPIGFIDKRDVIIAPNQAIYDPELYLMGVLSSMAHMSWIRVVAGRLKSDYRYSSSIVYNTFPFPEISEETKLEIEASVKYILKARASHSELTLAQMYDPDKMPDDLREAHHQNDLLIDSCYREKPFENDEERLEHLFKLYEKMIAKEQKQLEKEKAKKTTRKRTLKK